MRTRAPGSVNISVHVSVLDELSFVNHLKNVVLVRYKVVVGTVHLSWARLSCSVAHGEAEPTREILQQHIDECPLIRATSTNSA